MTDPPAPARTRLNALARRPALPAAGCFILGIVAHGILPAVPLFWLAWAVALAIGAGMTLRSSPRSCTLLLALGLAVAGVAAAQLEAYFYPRRQIGLFAGDTPRLAQLELRIDDPPRVLTNRFETDRPLPPKQVTRATVLRVRTWAGWEEATGRVLVQVVEPHPQLAAGQTVRVLGMLQRPAPAMNPGQFDWARYYRDQRILASVQIPQAGNIRILDSPTPGPLTRLREQVRRLLAAGFPAERSLDHALLRALLLGDGDPELRDVQEQFRRTGTSHHLAISGLHVAVLGGLVWWACRLLRVRPRAAAVAMTAFVVLYGAVALPSPPVVRSVLLCLAFGIGLTGRRSLDAVQLLSMSVLAMLIYQPLDLYNAGFQLSFGTVLGLMLFTKPMLAFFTRDDPDAQVLAGLHHHVGPVEYAKRWLDRSALTALAAGLVAWAVSMPLIAYHFGQLNPWAILAGILLAPLVFASLVGGLLKVLLTLLWPGFAGTWAMLAAWPVEGMRRAVDALTHLPWGDVPVPAPAPWAIALFYLLLVTALLPCPRPGLRWCLRGGRGLALPLLIFLPFRGDVVRQSPSPGEVRVTLLAVGAGQCAVIEPPSGRTVLVDAGSTSLTDLLAKCLGPFLRSRRYTDVDTILVSHANADHFNAVADVVAGYDVHEVLVGESFPRSAAANPAAAGLLRDLDRLERPPRTIFPGDGLPLGRDTRLEVLWPPKGSPLSPNDTSLVVRLTHAGRSVLFTGDIQEDAMRALLKSPETLKADVLIAPHHGSSEDATAAFVAAVNPTTIVSSNDRTLTGKQRRFDEIAAGRTLLRTHRRGSITIAVTREGELRVETFLDEKGRPAK